MEQPPQSPVALALLAQAAEPKWSPFERVRNSNDTVTGFENAANIEPEGHLRRFEPCCAVSEFAVSFAVSNTQVLAGRL